MNPAIRQRLRLSDDTELSFIKRQKGLAITSLPLVRFGRGGSISTI